MPETASCRRSAIISMFAVLVAAVCLLAFFCGIDMRHAYADEIDNIAFSVPAKVPFAVKADGTVEGNDFHMHVRGIRESVHEAKDGRRSLRLEHLQCHRYEHHVPGL